jgi:hypothetical protein
MIKFTIENNRLNFDSIASSENYSKIFTAYCNTGKLLVMTIEEFSAEITEAQHKLFKALLVKGSEISGYTYKEFEHEMIDSYAPYKYQKNIFDKMSRERKQVSEMNQKEFNIFIEQCIQFCYEFYDIKF